MNERTAHDRRQRRLLIGLALLFFAPLGLAFYLYYGPGTWHPGGHVNAGELITPARPLPALALPLLGEGTTGPNFLKGKWTLLYVGKGECTESCRRELYDTRQIRVALDRDMDRVQRVLVAEGGCCDTRFLHDEHPDLIAIRATPAAAPLLALLPERRQRGAACLSHRPSGQSHDGLWSGRQAKRHARGHETSAAAVLHRLTCIHNDDCSGSDGWRWRAHCSRRRWSCLAPGCASRMPAWGVRTGRAAMGMSTRTPATRLRNPAFNSRKHCTR